MFALTNQRWVLRYSWAHSLFTWAYSKRIANGYHGSWHKL